jgi:hypothetical protein
MTNEPMYFVEVIADDEGGHSGAFSIIMVESMQAVIDAIGNFKTMFGGNGDVIVSPLWSDGLMLNALTEDGKFEIIGHPMVKTSGWAESIQIKSGDAESNYQLARVWGMGVGDSTRSTIFVYTPMDVSRNDDVVKFFNKFGIIENPLYRETPEEPAFVWGDREQFARFRNTTLN